MVFGLRYIPQIIVGSPIFKRYSLIEGYWSLWAGMVFGLPLHARRPGCAGVAWLLKGNVQGFGVQGLGFRVQGLGFRATGRYCAVRGFRVQALCRGSQNCNPNFGSLQRPGCNMRSDSCGDSAILGLYGQQYLLSVTAVPLASTNLVSFRCHCFVRSSGHNNIAS